MFDPYLDDEDGPLSDVALSLLARDPTGERWGKIIRHTFDMIYNGQETGRYRWEDLMKTERTHIGTLFEINAQREFNFPGYDSDKTDYRIAGHPVDAKWSQKDGGWMLPPEVFGELALVGTGSDEQATWSLGLVRVRDEYRRDGSNRDSKSQLNVTGRSAVRWLWLNEALPPNVLLQLAKETVDYIMDSKSGAERTNRLFRAAEGMIVHRNAVATVSRQLDHQKRVRYNGGARSALRNEGILILSGTYYANLARAFGVPVPGRDEYVSVRVRESENTSAVRINGLRWVRARPGEPSVKPAPMLPRTGGHEDWAGGDLN